MINRKLTVSLLLFASTAAWSASGDLDVSFSSDGKVLTDLGGRESVGAVARQADGKIVVAGGMNGNFLVARYSSAGVLDTTFDGDGVALLDLGATDTALSLAIQSNGRIVVAGSSGGFAVVRLNPNGSLDSTFGHGGIVLGNYGGSGIGARANAVAIDRDGRIVIAGSSGDAGVNGGGNFGVARLNAEGTFDTSFSGDGRFTRDFGGVDSAAALALRSDGRIVVAGTANGGSASGRRSDFAVAVIGSTGIDTSFGAGAVNSPVTDLGGCSDGASAVAVQPDNKILVAGGAGANCLSGLPGTRPAVVRYNTNGSLDTSFSGDGIAAFGFGAGDAGPAVAMALQLDGAIVVAGATNLSTLATPHRVNVGLARVRGSDGAIDLAFSGDGMQQTSFGAGEAVPTAILLQPTDGRIVAAGAFTTFDANGAFQAADMLLARYHAITCNNLNVTRIGTNGADSIVGLSIPTATGTRHLVDVIHGMGGNDTIDGLGANDALCGGDGDDVLRGSDGDDTLFGNLGSDTMDAGLGTDTCFTILNEIDRVSSCETVNSGRSGLSGEWQWLEQHCNRSDPRAACELVGVLTAINPGEESTLVTTQVSYFLSDDAELSADDVLLGTGEVDALPPGSTHDLRYVQRVNGEQDLLGRFVIAFFDATDVIVERNEQNNAVPGLISGR